MNWELEPGTSHTFLTQRQKHLGGGEKKYTPIYAVVGDAKHINKLATDP